MSVAIVWALWAGNWFALLGIVVIGSNLLTQKTQRRAEGDRREAVADGVDPVQLRRVRPRAGRLSGAVLIVAALYLIANLAPLLTLP